MSCRQIATVFWPFSLFSLFSTVWTVLVIGISSTFCGRTPSRVNVTGRWCTAESPCVAPLRELRSCQGLTDDVSEGCEDDTFTVIWISSSSWAWAASTGDPWTGSDGTQAEGDALGGENAIGLGGKGRGRYSLCPTSCPARSWPRG